MRNVAIVCRRRSNRRQKMVTVLKLLIDKDSACFPKSSHRNPSTERTIFCFGVRSRWATVIARARCAAIFDAIVLYLSRDFSLVLLRFIFRAFAVCADAHRLSSKFIDLVHRDNRKHDPMRCSFLFVLSRPTPNEFVCKRCSPLLSIGSSRSRRI